MIDYLFSWIPKIQNFSGRLDSLSKIYNQPWVLINESNDSVKYLFKEKGVLLVIKNGAVTEGTWELINFADSILLNVENKKELYNHKYIDEGLMILKLDGNSNNLLVLANDRVIPNLDIQRYLDKKFPSNKVKQTKTIKPNIASKYLNTLKLYDGSNLHFINNKYFSWKGDTKVHINNHKAIDGFYRLKNSPQAFKISNSRLVMKYFLVKFKQPDGKYLELGKGDGKLKGGPAWIEGNLAPTGNYKKGWCSRVLVYDGIIIEDYNELLFQLRRYITRSKS